MKKLLTVLLIFLGLHTRGQETVQYSADSTSFFELSLEELMNMQVSVASKISLTSRESPGIVTVITEDEIRNSGAHDLMDVLRMVPGIRFGVDVEGVVGIGIRGNWGHEGKVLLLFDGQEMNERLFSTLQFGEHYPVDQVEKIEIIRGPGSSMYGGNAEYAVIKIITKNNKSFEGVSATASYGQMVNTFGSRSISVEDGFQMGDFSINAGIYAGEANRSDHIFRDAYGNTYDMSSQSFLRNYLVNFSTSYKNLSFRFLGDYYLIETRDGYDQILGQSQTEKFNAEFFDLQYTWKLSDKISMTPRLQYKREQPWMLNEEISPDDSPYWKQVSRPSANLVVNYDIKSNLNISGGAEYYIDDATDLLDSGTFSNGTRNVSYSNAAFFVQSLWKNKIANITLGTRLHLNNYYDPCFVPRIGLTRVLNKAHFKILYSMAFRTPGVENINLGIDIRPERTNVAEFETGIQLSAHSYLTANVYDITTHDAIIYFYDGDEGYRNGGKSGTRGVELDYKVKSTFGYADLNVSYYTSKGKSQPESSRVEEDESLLLAFPGWGVNGLVSLKLNENISINPSFSWLSEKYDIDGTDSEGKLTYTRYKPQLITSVFANVNRVKIKGVSVSAGCANLLNEKQIFIQPYNSNHRPLPGRSREFRITLRYELDKRKI